MQSLNGELTVNEAGLYKLLEVCEIQLKQLNCLLNYLQISDNLCPGVIVQGEDTFRVDWIPYPSAKISPVTKVDYDKSSNFHSRAPVCEGSTDFVDLDLTGKPQCMSICLSNRVL